LTIRLYKVADINGAGNYTAVSPFVLDFSGVSPDKTVSAQVWKTLTETAKSQADNLVKNAQITASATGTTTAGKLLLSELPVGLYLVDTVETASDYYEYRFTPSLISLPNNYFYDDTNPGDDTWVYNLTGEKAVDLKPQKIDSYGDLKITKFLNVYNDTQDGATFVFQVEGFKEDNDTGSRKTVYSDVVSIAFDKPGSKSLVIRKLPAGTQVTVTEVYSGANYALTSEASKTITLEAKKAEDTAFANTVEFANTHNRGLNGGTGVVNSFQYDGTRNVWECQQAEETGR